MRQIILKDYPKYVIYENGQIWSLSKECFISQCKTIDGYLQGNIITPTAKNGYRQSIKIHRLIALAFVPNPKNHKEVNHIDGDKLNNHYSNLEWCDRSHNLSHCHRLGLRSSRGKNNGNYKTGKYCNA